MMQPTRERSRGRRWLTLLAALSLLSAVLHGPCVAVVASVEATQGPDRPCALVCAEALAKRTPEALPAAAAGLLVAAALLVRAIRPSRTAPRRAPSLVALSISRT